MKIWIIAAGIIVVVLAIIYLVTRKTRPASEPESNIGPREAEQLIRENRNNPGFVLIDVRTPNEYINGHIAGSVNIDYHSPVFESKIDSLDRDKTYLLYCRSGNRSGHALSMMKQKNFQKVYHLRGGIISWNQQGLAVE